MPLKRHNRQYDVVVFGATGFTGKFTCEHIIANLPSKLKWAVAGRSESKLREVVDECKQLDPDRVPPEIEICGLTDDDLIALTAKTFILITTVGPYAKYGEHAFKACAESGTHYFDVTGESPWTYKMIQKHEAAAKASGAMMFPQIGLESAPPDLLVWLLGKRLRTDLSAQLGDTTVSIHTLQSAPSGGTLATVLTLFEVMSLKEIASAFQPFALSPIPNATPRLRKSLLTSLTGLVTVPHLGRLTTSLAGSTDAAIVERTWGLLSTLPSRRNEVYGPNFTFREFYRPATWLQGMLVHWALGFFGLLIATVPPFRSLVRRMVFQPGEGQPRELTVRDKVEYRATAVPDGAAKGKLGFGRAWHTGGIYAMTGLLLSQAALTLLEDDLQLDGGVYTPACLGQGFIDRLDATGFHFETNIIDA